MTHLRWLALLLLTPPFVMAAPAPVGLQHNVVFPTYPAYASNGELLRRLKSPLTVARVEASLHSDPGVLRAHPLNPTLQHFSLYVPHGPPPPNGYALLVFVPPWDTARIPIAWISTLDRTHTILVTAAHSGNDANVFERREPLALLAAYGVTQRYRINPAQVYVGGFSGGSRVALRIALGFPDVFRGALLDAGSDPIGTAQIPLPSVTLFHRFQQSTRIVFLTGNDDLVRQAQLARASQSLRNWCVFDTDSITLLHTGHTLADSAGFARGIDALMAPRTPAKAALTACREKNEKTLHAALRRVTTLLTADKRDQARDALMKIDARFGGLAAPRSVALMDGMQSHAEAK